MQPAPALAPWTRGLDAVRQNDELLPPHPTPPHPTPPLPPHPCPLPVGHVAVDDVKLLKLGGDDAALRGGGHAAGSGEHSAVSKRNATQSATRPGGLAACSPAAAEGPAAAPGRRCRSTGTDTASRPRPRCPAHLAVVLRIPDAAADGQRRLPAQDGGAAVACGVGAGQGGVPCMPLARRTSPHSTGLRPTRQNHRCQGRPPHRHQPLPSPSHPSCPWSSSRWRASRAAPPPSPHPRSGCPAA